jgi:hypothetical protein
MAATLVARIAENFESTLPGPSTAHTDPQNLARWQLLPDGASVGRPNTLSLPFLQSQLFIARNSSRSSGTRLTRCPRPRFSTASRIKSCFDLYAQIDGQLLGALALIAVRQIIEIWVEVHVPGGNSTPNCEMSGASALYGLSNPA